MVCQLLAAAGLAVGVVVGRVTKNEGTRKMMKSAIRGGFAAGKAVQTAFGGIKEQISDLAAEAKAEMAQAKAPVSPPSASTGTPTPPPPPSSPMV